MSEIYSSKILNISKSERETEDFAFGLARSGQIKTGDIIALYGDLGAGKTAFTRGLVRFFSPESRVASPTFSLVNQYKNIFHFDMYRINSEEDLLSIGFYDYLDNLYNKIIIIEWFDIIKDFFDENTINIEIIKLNFDERKIIFERLLK
ncbi:MAG: tRNA (adenosine(37)-N6)-threonylcarbamoyltransferase complex ATPase subunit type 1 TsaE [Oscillospiraceae bacterium]|nr:tRNA (adenosine(37)-N6)-threonylcarbamoyltransferase complex ATPase subunit type 1 TsaE [Oscillospiraceae bacterium]